MERGQVGGLNYKMPILALANPAAQQQYAQQQQGTGQAGGDQNFDNLDGPRTALTELYENYGLLKSIVADLERKGIAYDKPDYSQPDGGLEHQAWLAAEANIKYAADRLAAEKRKREAANKAMLEGKALKNPGYNPNTQFIQDDSYASTSALPGIEQANESMAQETNDINSQSRANQLSAAEIADIDQMVADGILSPFAGELQKKMLVENRYKTQQFAPQRDYDYSSGSGANAGMTAYVTRFSQLANGLGYEPGETFDEAGNRVDIARPSEFVGRVWGFQKNGQPFVTDRFERRIQPDGTFKVHVVSKGGDILPVDPTNIVGSLRGFIETNEGATALKDFNKFLGGLGINTATQAVPADLFASKVEDLSDQTKVAPKVTAIREKISRSLDELGSGFTTGVKNVVSAATRGLTKFTPTEIEYITKKGSKIIVKRDGDDYKIDNYQDLFGKPDKSGVVTIDGKKFNVNGTFKKVPKDVLMRLLDSPSFGIVSVKLKDEDGKSVDVEKKKPLTPEEQKRAEALKKKFGITK